MLRVFLLFLFFLTFGYGFSQTPDPVSSDFISPSIPPVSDSFIRRLRYVQSNFDAISKPGFEIKEEDGIPVLVSFLCGSAAENDAAVHFFTDTEFCSKDVRFFPGAETVLVRQQQVPYHTGQGWNYVQANGFTLFYRTQYHPAENTMPDGQKVIVLADGAAITEKGSPVFPVFLFKKGEWQPFLPLKEMYLLTDDGADFSIELVSSSRVPDKEESLISFFGIRSETAFVRKTPSKIMITGKKLKGAAIPFLSVSSSAGNATGIYRIQIASPRKNQKTKEKKISLDGADLSFLSNNQGVFFEMIITKPALTDQESQEIGNLVKKWIPSYFNPE